MAMKRLRQALPIPSISDKRAAWRIALGVLAALNLVALALIAFPPGGSVAQLDEELSALRKQLTDHQLNVKRLRSMAEKVKTARSQQDAFMKQYFMASETTSSTILS
jgi:hypothetical protein